MHNYIYIYIYIHLSIHRRTSLYTPRATSCRRSPRCSPKKGGRMLLVGIPLARIARQGTGCLVSIIPTNRKARVEQFELDEGFQPYHPPL